MIHDFLAADPDLSMTSDILARRGGKSGSISVSGTIGLVIVAVVIGIAVRILRDPVKRATWMRRLSSIGSNSGQAAAFPHSAPSPHLAPLPQPSPGDVSAALNPATPPATLAHMIDNAPPLRSYVAANPSTPSGLLQKLSTMADPLVDKELAARGFTQPGPFPPRPR
ncbi:variant leucine-rich repeat-containing protein [Gordonia sp. MP11Mi]|uniref:variant leucine-rich repeat-containing protein n=1 Tax=Gordonia sp. MP11Mi TaxID=3022769 RepID=UPI003B2279BB